MLLKRVVAMDDGAEASAGVGRPQLFAVPRLLVGLGAARCGAAAPDYDLPTTARSPTSCAPPSPLDLRPFAALGGSMLRSPHSPRSWDSHRIGLDSLVDDDALAKPAAGARNRLLGPQMRYPFKLPQCLSKSFTIQLRDCGQAAPQVLGNVGTGAGAKPVLCSRSYGDVKSSPEVTVPVGAQPGATSHPADLGNLLRRKTYGREREIGL